MTVYKDIETKPIHCIGISSLSYWNVQSIIIFDHHWCRNICANNRSLFIGTSYYAYAHDKYIDKNFCNLAPKIPLLLFASTDLWPESFKALHITVNFTVWHI